MNDIVKIKPIVSHKYKIRDIVVVYKCDEYPLGFLGVIMDRDATEKVYLVKDVMKQDVDRWVREENLHQIFLTKPKSVWEKIRRAFR